MMSLSTGGFMRTIGFILLAVAAFSWQEALAGERDPFDRAGEMLSAQELEWIKTGALLPRPVGMTHVCGDLYPAQAPATRPKAGPKLKYVITADGTVKNIEIAISSGDPSLDKAAVACATRWKYKPARLNGRPVDMEGENNVGWTMPEPVAEEPAMTIATQSNTITVQSKVSSLPPISSPVSIGKPHSCSVTEFYPREAIAAGMQGTTTIAFTITVQGTVENVRVVGTSGYDLLDQTAVMCAKAWRYSPAIAAGGPIAVPWKAQVGFLLNRDDGSHPIAIGAPHVCTAKYPADAKAAHAEGRTEVSFVIGADGGVKNIAVTKSSGHKSLDSAFVACVETWRYTPAQKDGKPVEMPWQAAMAWTLPPE